MIGLTSEAAAVRRSRIRGDRKFARKSKLANRNAVQQVRSDELEMLTKHLEVYADQLAAQVSEYFKSGASHFMIGLELDSYDDVFGRGHRHSLVRAYIKILRSRVASQLAKGSKFIIWLTPDAAYEVVIAHIKIRKLGRVQ